MRHHCLTLAALAAIFFGCPSTARCQNTGFATERPVEDRLRDLESTVQQLQQAKIAPSADVKPAITAGWDEKKGFFLQSPDNQFFLRITGQVQTDYRQAQDEHDALDLPGFSIRRARLGIEATVFEHYEYRFLPEFGQGNIRLQDAYLNIHYWNEVQFEAGKFKQPFSYEQLIQDRFVPFMERSLIDQLVPARDIGLMLHGTKLFDDRIDYGASIYNGVINGDSDTDRNKEAAGRIAVRPLRALGLPDWAEPIQLGIAGTFGNDRGVLAPNPLRTPAGVPWFQFLPTVRPDGTRTRWSPEVAYFYGPLGFAAQYYDESQELLAPAAKKLPATVVDVRYRGGYAMGTLLLTGETRTTYSQAIMPLAPFDPREGCYGPGAWELVGRVSWLDLSANDPAAFGRLMDPLRSATRATELTVGFNWYLNGWVRLLFNYEHAQFNNGVRLGTTNANKLDHQNTFMGRFQIIF
ncbi:MAG TPA: porin [Gemmataceae bacterium]|nr:porin [Gemmataceae bacterium]